jgi:hypothetical protein
VRKSYWLQRLLVTRHSIYRYDQPLVKFSPLLLVSIFTLLLVFSSASTIFDSESSSALSAGPNTVSASGDCVNTTGIGTVAWTSPGNAFSDNAVYASASVDGTTTNYIVCTNYGFSIPTGSTIDGIVVAVERKSNSTGNGGSQDAAMRAVKGGIIGTTDRSTTTTYTTSDVSENHGSSTDLWGTTWSVTDINASNFGAAFAAQKANAAGSAHTVTVDVITITVHYSPPPIDQTHYRWRDDSTALNTDGGWLAAEDTIPSSDDVKIGNVLRLRVELDATGAAGTVNTGYRLEWANKAASCSVSSGWTRLDTGSDAWEMAPSSQFADGDALTAPRLTGDEPTFVNGYGLESPGDDQSAAIQLDADDYTEIEWAIRATSSASDGASYCFRVVDDTGVALNAYNVYPEVTLFESNYAQLTQEAYIFENDNGANADSNSQQAAGNTALTNVKKGERLNLRTQIKNTGDKELADSLALFYDRGDNIWTKVENDKPDTSAGSGCADSAWSCSSIRATSNTGFYTSVAFDLQGRPWVTFVDQTNGYLFYANYDSSGSSTGSGCTTGWVCNIIDGVVGGSQSSITIGKDGGIWISYMDDAGGNGVLAVAQFVGSGGTGCTFSTAWSCTNIDTAIDSGYYTDIAINPKTGNPWISYANSAAPQAFEVAQFVGSGGTGCAVSSWTCYTVLDDANDYGAEYTGIAFDGAGVAWTSFHDDTNGDLYVAKYVGSSGTGCTSSAWTCTAVATANDSGDIGTAIAIDSKGNPAVAFREVSTGGDLKLARYLGGATTGTGCAVNTWNCTTIDTVGDVGAYASLAFDVEGNPWISYRDTTNQNPKVARYLGGATTGTGCAINTWSCTSVLTTSDNDGFFTSLAFAPNGNAWLAFHDATNGDAEYAVLNRNAEFTTSPSLAASNGAILSESHSDMTSTSDTANRDDADCTTATTWNNGLHSITEELTGLILPNGDVTSQCSEVSWTIDTSQALEGTTYRFVVASKDSWRPDKGVWRGPIDIAQYPTVTIEADTTLRAAKTANPVFANCAVATNWGCQTVHATNATGNESYVKVSPEGVPWISYNDTTAADLWVANYVGSGGNCDTLVGGSDAWQCTLVEATGTVAFFTSLDFDKEGKPWVAYTRGISSNLDLAVAQYVGGGAGTGCGGGSADWTCTTVASTNHIGSYPSIAFDIYGAAMIAYRDETGGDLEFARYVGSGGNCDTLLAGSDAWQCSTIDATNNVGYAAAMEVAGDGTIWIAHQDFTTGAVKTAKYVGAGGNCDNTGGSDAWQCTTVDDRGTNVMGYDIDIAIDSQGRPWIAHLDNTAADLELVRYVGGGTGNCNIIGTGSADWFCETIQATNNVGYTPGIAISPNDTALVSYTDLSTNRLKTARFVGSGGNCAGLGGSAAWQCTDITTSGGYYTSIDFDDSGTAWISHTANGFTDLFIAKQHFSAEPLSTNLLGPNVPSGDAAYRLDRLGYSDVSIEDTALDAMIAGVFQSPLYTFSKTLSSGTKPIIINWTGQSTVSMATRNVLVQAYNNSTKVWDTLTTQSSCAADTDCTIEYTISSPANYLRSSDGDFVFDLRVYQVNNTVSQTLKTDLIDISQPSEPMNTIEGYIFENDDGTSADTNTAQVAGANTIAGVKKGERINLRTQLTNTGGNQASDYALFYDRGDNIWTKVENNAPISGAGSGCNDFDFNCIAVDSGSFSGQYTSIAVDSNNRPWISYWESNVLVVANYVGSGGTGCATPSWTCTSVITSNSPGLETSIAISQDNTVWVSFRDAIGGYDNLSLARYVGSGGTGCSSSAWTCTLVYSFAGDDVSSGGSIAVDNSGNPSIVFQVYITSPGVTELRLARYVGSGGTGCSSSAWTCTTIDAGDYSQSSLTFSTDGTILISSDKSTDLLFISYVESGGNCSNNAWQCEVVDSTDTVGYSSSISLGPSGDPWISYADGTNGNLEIARYVGSGGNCDTVGAGSDAWECTTVDATDTVGAYTSLAFDASGNANISYYDSSNQNLEIARYVGSGGNCDTVGAGSDAWECTTVDSAGGVGAYTSLAFDASGNANISYYDSSNQNLKVATINRQAEITLSPSGAATNGAILSESHADMTSVTDSSNRDDADCLAVGAVWNNGRHSNVTEIGGFLIPKGEVTPQCTELSWTIDTSQALPGTTYRFAVATKDNWRPDKGTWRGPIAIDTYPTITISADTDIRYSKTTTPSWTGCDTFGGANLGSADWSCVTVDDKTDIVSNSPMSMAFDSENNPWIAYNNGTDIDLIVARYVGSGGNCDTYDTGSSGSDAWECTTVAGLNINAGATPSIAFDPSGNAWVVSNTEANLMVSKYVGSGGNCDTFDVATSGSNAWECYYIDDPASDNVGNHASIKFTSKGIPWVSYRDSIGNDLHVAYYVGSDGNCDTYEVGSSGSDAWNCTVVEATGNVGDYSMLTIDSNDIPWISYKDGGTNSVKVARYVGSGGNCDATGGSDAWQCTVVDDQTDALGNDTAITTNSDGIIQIAYQNSTDGSLVIAEHVGSGGNCDTYAAGSTGSDAWQCTVIDDQTGDVGFDINMAVGSQDRNWIVYQAEGGGNTQVAYYVGSGGNCDTYAAGSTGSDAWQCIIVDDQADGVGDYPAVAVDNSGIPWIAYQNWSDGSLVVAKIKVTPGPLGSDRGSLLIPSGDLSYRITDGRSPRSNEPGSCGSALAAMMGYCGIFDNQGDYDSITAGVNEIPIYAGAVKFDSNTELPEIRWEGRTDVAPSTAGTAGDIVLQVYRFGTTNAWETITSDTASTDCNTVDCVLSGAPSGTVSEYFELEDGRYWVYFRVYQEAHTTAINFKVDKFNAQTTEQRLRGGRTFENGVRRPLLTE